MNATGIHELEQALGRAQEAVRHTAKRSADLARDAADAVTQHEKAVRQVADLETAVAEARGVDA